MTTSLQPHDVHPSQAGTVTAQQRAGWGALRRGLLVILGVVALAVGAYALAWFNAHQLTSRFAHESDESYANGNYLDALVGHEEFDPDRNQNVRRGGYIRIERMWSGPYSWPMPPIVEEARVRSREIVNERLTVAEAEHYVRQNIGRPALYFAEIYLRLGELYEEEGDLPAAREIYESVPELFSFRQDLVERANAHLQRLEGQ
jgi:hypothetical protein